MYQPAPHTQGEHGSAEVPTEPQRNQPTEPDRNTRDRIAAMLNGHPITGTQVAAELDCTAENARKHLRNLAAAGIAKKHGRGYVRA